MTDLEEAISLLPLEGKVMQVYCKAQIIGHVVRAQIVKETVLGIPLTSKVIVLGSYPTAEHAERIAQGVRTHIAAVKRLTE